MKTKKEVTEILNILHEYYGDTKCGLDFRSPFELLIATILSAQCTDVRVNIITKDLFAAADTPIEMASLGVEKVGEIIKSCGLYKNKSKNIVRTSEMLCDEYGEVVPDTMEELIRLPGVGRKTANVVLSNAFGVPAIAVDTHVQRVSNRIGLVKTTDVVKTEEGLMKALPKDKWSDAHHWLIWHGRKICSARNPKCDMCPLSHLCDYYTDITKRKKSKT